jgi:hypothetical protein
MRPHGELPGLHQMEKREGGSWKMSARTGSEERCHRQLFRPESKAGPALCWAVGLPYPLQSVCHRHSYSLTQGQGGSKRGRHGHHSHVPQAIAARQLPGVIYQRPYTVVQWMESRYQRLQELYDHLCAIRTAINPAPNSIPVRGTNPIGWHNSPHIERIIRRTAHRMALLGLELNMRSKLSIRNGVLLYKQLIPPLTDYACTIVRRLQGVTIQVSSPYYGRSLVPE